MGWRVYPCSRPDNGGKAPWCANGFRDAVADIAAICRWIEDKPGCNWGVWPGDGFLTLDADAKHKGIEVLASLEGKHGKLPPTPTALTGGGGRHLYFSCPPSFMAKNKIADCEGLEIISGKGGVIIPPSVHGETGKAYSWRSPPWEIALAPAPAWLLAMVEAKPQGESQEIDLDTLTWGGSVDFATLKASEGDNNAPVCRAIGTHLGRGESEEEVLEKALAWAEAQDPPYDAEEMRRKVRSIARKEERKQQTPPPPQSEKVSVRVEEDRSDDLTPGKEGRKEEREASDRDTFFLPSFPTLSPEAYFGLAGEIVRAVGPELEGQEEGVLLCLLSAVGNAIGPGPVIDLGTAGRHRAILSAVLVAKSGMGKSEPWEVVSRLMERAVPDWLAGCVIPGVGTGEGLVERVKDERVEQQPVKEKGVITGYKDVVVPEAKEKRCFAVEAEFGKVLTLARREGSTLSPNLCSAWDGKPMGFLNRGQNSLRATGHHVSVWGNITDEELNKRLTDSLEAVNGFANRFLWLRQKRMRKLPWGGDMGKVYPFAERLAGAIAIARGIGELSWDEEAMALWEPAYDALCDTQGEMPCLGRARSQALRLILLYALLDGGAVIRSVHVRAGLAVWRYCEASARYLFKRKDDNKPPTPSVKAEEPLSVRLCRAIAERPGIEKSDLLRAFRSADAKEIDKELADLEAKGMAHRRMKETAGRSAECWLPGPCPEPPGGGGKEGRKKVWPMAVRARACRKEGRKEVSPRQGEPMTLLPSFLPRKRAVRRPGARASPCLAFSPSGGAGGGSLL